MKFKIKNIFKIDLRYWKESFFLLFLVMFYSLFKINVILKGIDSFRDYLLTLISTDILMGITFMTFWSLIYLSILFLAFFKEGMNITFSFLLGITPWISNLTLNSIVLLSALGILIVGMVIFFIDSIKEERKKRFKK